MHGLLGGLSVIADDGTKLVWNGQQRQWKAPPAAWAPLDITRRQWGAKRHVDDKAPRGRRPGSGAVAGRAHFDATVGPVVRSLRGAGFDYPTEEQVIEMLGEAGATQLGEMLGAHRQDQARSFKRLVRNAGDKHWHEVLADLG
jgi:hypothetical protein